MILLEVARRRRSLYLLTLDTGEQVEVDRRTFDESPYGAGQTISPAALEALLAQSMYNRARDRALYLLGLRDYACGELEKKLVPEATPEVASAVVARLQEVGLLDDRRYAANRASALQRYKQYPKSRVEQELRRRGVDAVVARGAVEDLPGEDFELALALIEKKYYNKLQDEDSRRRVIAALARRGFSYGAIRQALEAFSGRAMDEENEEIWE